MSSSYGAWRYSICRFPAKAVLFPVISSAQNTSCLSPIGSVDIRTNHESQNWGFVDKNLYTTYSHGKTAVMYFVVSKDATFCEETRLGTQTRYALKLAKIGIRALGRSLFCFSLTRASCMRPAGKKRKKHTEHERVQFWVPRTRDCALRARHTVH